MAKDLKFGVIGLGMGRHHLKCLVEHPGVTVPAICDVNAATLAAFQKEYQIKTGYADAEKMIAQEKLDGVVIATPNKFHAPLTIAAFEKNMHVLCEKPLAMNTGEALQMLAASKMAGKKFMINLSYRFTPAAHALKRQIEVGKLGEIYFARTVWHRRRGIPGFGGWFSTKALSGGGPLIDLGVHRIDLALWLMGAPKIKSVSASNFNFLGTALAQNAGKVYDVEDLAVAFLRMENGAVMNVEISWAINRQEKEYMQTRIYGTLGGAVHENIGESYDFRAKVFTEEGGFFVSKEFDDGPKVIENPVDHFVNCILNDTTPLATGEDGVRMMQILDGIYKSAELQQEIRI